MRLVYTPSKDTLFSELHRIHGKPNRRVGPCEFWLHKRRIHAVAIANYREELDEFKKNLSGVLTAKALLESGIVGMWKDRTDIRNSTEFARKLRDRAQARKWD